ncbi:hypothetical protein NBRC110019_16360 [Neptunitalea chrysea]|uniref:DUF1795 domain-containing protein n=1 Tax=Neptunitalea chrysea TaxID=1647581 RepID=A0A9W6EV77_9FLAO|nr:hypothetical protein [Neptunitalea chrysea]GLB52596.1 hypothetical protein NBRC110019_16360 [Neptunitalea chrysea]
MQKLMTFLVFISLSMSALAQTTFVLDTASIENPKFKKPVERNNADITYYSTYTADTLQLQIRIPDSLVVFETTHDHTPIINIGISPKYYDPKRATNLVIVKTLSTLNPEELVVKDILNIYENFTDHLEDLMVLKNGKDRIDGQDAYWYMATYRNTETDEINTTLSFYVVHPVTKKAYNIFIFSFEPLNYTKQLSIYYNYLQTIKFDTRLPIKDDKNIKNGMLYLGDE